MPEEAKRVISIERCTRARVGEQIVHLRQATAQGVCEAGIGGELAGLFGVGPQNQVIDDPLKVFQRPGPAVALAVDEALRHHQGMRLALGREAPNLAKQRRNVGKASGGQHPRHFGLGMNARGHLAQQLQHDGPVDDHRAVALLCGGPFDLRAVYVHGGAVELQFAQCGVDARLGAEAFQDTAHELGGGEAVGEGADPRSAPDPGEGQVVDERVGHLVLPGDGHG